jgi:putative ABC transport system substrate-binding protein
MRRREFITLVASAATWPATGWSQEAKLSTIGFLGGTGAFVQRMRELGWIEGRTVEIQYRWAEGRPDRYHESLPSS